MAAVYEDFEEKLGEAEERPFNYGYFKRLMRYLKPYARPLSLVGVIVVIGTAANLLEPYLIAQIIDVGVANEDIPLILKIVALLVVFRFMAWGAGYLRVFNINRIGQGVLYDLRSELFGHIQKLSLRFYDNRPVGKIMSRITSDVGSINELLNGGVMTIMVEGLSLVGIVVIMLALDWRMALIAFSITPTFYLLFGKLQGKIEGAWMNVRKSASNMNANLNESINGVRVTQAFGREERNITRFVGVNQVNRNANVRAVKLDNLIWPSVELVGVTGSALLIMFGGSQVIAGSDVPGHHPGLHQLRVAVLGAGQRAEQGVFAGVERDGIGGAHLRVSRHRTRNRGPAGRQAHAAHRRRGQVRGRALQVRGDQPRRLARRRPGRRAGTDGGHRRPHGRRQDHHHQPDHALL